MTICLFNGDTGYMFKTDRQIKFTENIFGNHRQSKAINLSYFKRTYDTSPQHLLKNTIWEEKESYYFYYNKTPIAIVTQIRFQIPSYSAYTFNRPVLENLFIIHSSFYNYIMYQNTSLRKKTILCEHDFPLVFSTLQSCNDYLMRDDYKSFQWKIWLPNV